MQIAKSHQTSLSSSSTETVDGKEEPGREMIDFSDTWCGQNVGGTPCLHPNLCERSHGAEEDEWKLRKVQVIGSNRKDTASSHLERGGLQPSR